MNNNNQQNQAIGVLGGLTGFAIVANTADGKNVVTILTDFNTALTALQTVVGSGSLPAGASDIIDGLNDLTTALGVTNGVVSGHTAAIAALPTVAFKKISDGANNFDAASAADTLSVEGTNDVTVSLDAATKKITISGLTLKNAIAAIPKAFTEVVIGGASKVASAADSEIEFVGADGVTVSFVNGKVKISGLGLLTATAAASTYFTQAAASALPTVNIKTVAGDNGTSITIENKDDGLKIYGSDGIETTADDSDHTLMISGETLNKAIGNMTTLFDPNLDNLVDAINKVEQRLRAIGG